MSQHIYTVSELNRSTALLLNEHFLAILVEGEISNLSIPPSGHCYFTLKDAGAQVRCAMFKSQQRRSFKAENGKQVIIKAQVSLYEPRGDYQLIVDHMEEAGDGALRRAFDALKVKLSEEGLFSDAYKMPLPRLPKTIGIITSPTGAAVRDIITVLNRRFSAIPIIIYPTAVQGGNAKYEICSAIALANTLKQCDVLILARGGGSLEDLWAFNEEMVARAIHASQIPIISGVGHETDTTIADFVADLRAPTPSAAAEHATPDQQQWLTQFKVYEQHLQNHIQRTLRQLQQKLDWLSGRLNQQHPQQKLIGNQQRLGNLEARLNRAMHHELNKYHRYYESSEARLWQNTPRVNLERQNLQLNYLNDRLIKATNARVSFYKQRFIYAGQNLHTVSPLATLNRGYALVTEPISGSIIRSYQQLKQGAITHIQLAEGSYNSTVSELFDDSKPETNSKETLINSRDIK